MRMRVKIVPNDQPNLEGWWISRKVPGGNKPFGERYAPKGFHIVAVRRPHRARMWKRMATRHKPQRGAIAMVIRISDQASPVLERMSKVLEDFSRTMEETTIRMLGLSAALQGVGERMGAALTADTLDAHLRRRRPCHTPGACRDMGRCLSVHGCGSPVMVDITPPEERPYPITIAASAPLRIASEFDPLEAMRKTIREMPEFEG